MRLEDDELLDEVELTANLIVAANQSEAHMSDTEIDEILGVIPRARARASEIPAAARHSWHSDVAAIRVIQAGIAAPEHGQMAAPTVPPGCAANSVKP